MRLDQCFSFIVCSFIDSVWVLSETVSGVWYVCEACNLQHVTLVASLCNIVKSAFFINLWLYYCYGQKFVQLNRVWFLGLVYELKWLGLHVYWPNKRLITCFVLTLLFTTLVAYPVNYLVSVIVFEFSLFLYQLVLYSCL